MSYNNLQTKRQSWYSENQLQEEAYLSTITNQGDIDYKDPVPNESGLPAIGNEVDDFRIALDTGFVYKWTGTEWLKPEVSGSGGSFDDYTFAGETRFGDTVNLTSGTEALDYVLAAQYTTPSLSISAAPTFNLFEKGDALGTIANIALTGNVTRTFSGPEGEITLVEFLRNASVIDTPTPLPGSASYNYTDTTGVDGVTDTSYGFRVTDGVGAYTSTGEYEYIYPFFSGAVDFETELPDGGSVPRSGIVSKSDSQTFVKKKSNTSVDFNLTGVQFPFFAYPASYGDLTDIIDQNGFSIIASNTKKTIDFTSMLDGTTQSYTVYQLGNQTTGNFTFNYIF